MPGRGFVVSAMMIERSRFCYPREGIYTLMWRGQPVYAGETKNLYQRIYFHIQMRREFDYVWFEPIRGEENRRKAEEFLIKQLNPPLNIAYPQRYYIKKTNGEYLVMAVQ